MPTAGSEISASVLLRMGDWDKLLGDSDNLLNFQMFVHVFPPEMTFVVKRHLINKQILT